MVFKKKIRNYLDAGYPGLAIQTTEEARAIKDILATAKELNQPVVIWSVTEGLRQIAPTLKAFDETQDLVKALEQRVDEAIYILRDPQLWPFDRDPMLNRTFRDLLTWAPTKGACVISIGHEFKAHPAFEKLVTVIEYALPSKEDLGVIAAGIMKSAKESPRYKDKKIEATDEVIRALGGLSTTEAENALSLSLVETEAFTPDVIYREKVQAVKKSGLLEIIEPDSRGLDAIGGLEELKGWIKKRKRAYTPEAEKFGLPAPKGIMIVGVPGTGKSLSAKAIGTALGVPTVRLDIGSLFNSLVGESESRARDALALAEAMSPCVLWIDEIDKGLAGSSGSGSNDSGVTRRVFGTVISWMQERRRPVFLVATANQVEGLPPELLRKGRFDELFAIDLPKLDERREIFAIQLKANGRDPEKFDLGGLGAASQNFTGSEIAAVIHESLFNAFDQDAELNDTILIEAINQIVPLATTAKEQIEAIRTWAKTRARFASKATILADATNGRRKLSK